MTTENKGNNDNSPGYDKETMAYLGMARDLVKRTQPEKPKLWDGLERRRFVSLSVLWQMVSFQCDFGESPNSDRRRHN